MTAVGMVQVTAHQKVRMPGVRNSLMAAVWAVYVAFLMAGARVVRRAFRPIRRCGPERVLIHMIAVDVVQMAVMEIVDVTVVLHCLANHL
jgi:hypothetical protein